MGAKLKTSVIVLGIVVLVGLSAIAMGTTISGVVELDGDSAVDGSTFSYDLDDDDEVDDLTVELTGVDNKQKETQYGTLSSGSIDSVDVYSDKEPENAEIKIYTGYEVRNVEKQKSVERDDESVTINPNATYNVGDEATLTLDDKDYPENFTYSSGKTYTPDDIINVDLDAGVLKEFNINVVSDNGFAPYDTEFAFYVEGEPIHDAKVVTNDGDSWQIDTNVTIEEGDDLILDSSDTGGSGDPSGGLEVNSLEFVYKDGTEVTVDGTDMSIGDSIEVPISNAETESVDVATTANYLGLIAEWEETDGVSDLELNVDGDEYVKDGLVDSSELVFDLDDLETGTNSIGLSYNDGGSELSYALDWDATTQTKNPEIDINGHQSNYAGVLDDGESISLDVDDEWIQPGSNEIEVGVDDPETGPVGQVDLDYSHSTTGDAHSSSVDSTEWSEDRVVERTFSSDRDDVEIEIPLDSRVVDVRSVEVLIDGSEITADYDVDGTDLTVEVGDVIEDETVEIEVDSRKVSVDNGEIEIIDPTVEGDRLDTEVEVVELDSDDDLRIDVSETQTADDGDRLIWTDDESYDAETSSIIGSDGSQILSTNANDGSTFRAVSTDVIGSTVSSGTATITDIDQSDEELSFSVDKSDSISVFGLGYDRIGYHALISDSGRLIDEGDGHVETRDSGSYVIEESDPSTLVGGISAPGDSSETILGIPLFVWLIGGVVGGIGAAAAVSQRVGTDPDDRFSRVVFGLGSAGVLIVASELVTPYSLVDAFIGGLFGTVERLLVTVTTGSFAALVGSLGVLGLIVVIDQRTDVEIPLPYYVGASSMSLFFLIESVAPGVLIESLSSGLEEISALIWILLIGGPMLLIALWLRSRRPEINIGGETQ